ncbi:MAG: Gfo/Idh/MocA family oxidoreductase, partial [Actinomycetota bacterium]|nr:Gfo/Idh/MocA family oxidoreductase [Actinomycetota bacterium]
MTSSDRDPSTTDASTTGAWVSSASATSAPAATGSTLPGAGRIAVVGAGILGVRIARELLTPGADAQPTNDGITVVTRRRERRTQVAAAFGDQVRVVQERDGAERALSGTEISTVVVAREAGAQFDVARSQLEAGRHVVCTTDDPDEVRALLDLDELAVARGVRLFVGAAMSPGLSCLLVRHAAGELDEVDEIHVSRHGAAGPACARQRLRALRGTAVDWRDGAWVRRPGFSGRELSWFPDPIGARDCYRAELAEPALLVPCFPGVQRVTARLAASRRDRAFAPFPVLVPPPDEGGIGAIRVELRGASDGARRSVVYGALDRPAVAGAAVAAVTALH